MKKSAQATAAAAATVLGTNAAQGAGPDDKKITEKVKRMEVE